MARPGGNPGLVDHQFSTDRDEKLSQKITIRITESMLKDLQGIGNYREFCRRAIARAIAEVLANDESLAENKERDSIG